MVRESRPRPPETHPDDVRPLLEDLAPETLRRISRAELDRMVAAGVFEDESERFELLRGVLVRMTPIGTDHQESVDLLNETFTPALLGRARVRVQGPFAATDDSEPQPDLGVHPQASYAREHPAQALLLVEVADSSLRKDRRVKRSVYAEAGVPEYWILNLRDRRLEVHRAPRGGDYAQVTVHGPDETVACLAFPDLRIRVGALLPAE